MFFPFVNYREINVAQTNTNNQLLFTASARCVVYFLPIGSRMEANDPVGIFANNHWVDSDGYAHDTYLYREKNDDIGNQEGNTSRDFIEFGQRGYTITPVLIASGTQIRTFITDSSDRVGGTLFVFELPPSI